MGAMEKLLTPCDAKSRKHTRPAVPLSRVALPPRAPKKSKIVVLTGSTGQKSIKIDATQRELTYQRRGRRLRYTHMWAYIRCCSGTPSRWAYWRGALLRNLQGPPPGQRALFHKQPLIGLLAISWFLHGQQRDLLGCGLRDRVEGGRVEMWKGG